MTSSNFFSFHICYVNYDLGRSSEYLCAIITSNKVVWNKNGNLNFLWISVFWRNKFFLEAPRRLVILVIRNSKIGLKNPFLGSNSRTIKRTKFLQKFKCKFKTKKVKLINFLISIEEFSEEQPKLSTLAISSFFTWPGFELSIRLLCTTYIHF